MSRPHINLTMLRVLDALERERNYTRAGERLGLTQSGVSHAVRALEEAVGGPVIARGTRDAELTALGEAALIEARAVIVHLDRLGALRDREPVAGQVRLGTVRSAAASILPEALDALRRRHPDIGVELLVVPEDHPLADKATVPWSAVHRLPFVMSGSGCEPSILAAVESAGAELDVVLRVRGTQALLAMVRAGIGITVLPTLATIEHGNGLAVRDLVPRLTRVLWMMSSDGVHDAATIELDGAIRLTTVEP